MKTGCFGLFHKLWYRVLLLLYLRTVVVRMMMMTAVCHGVPCFLDVAEALLVSYNERLTCKLQHKVTLTPSTLTRLL